MMYTVHIQKNQQFRSDRSRDGRRRLCMLRNDRQKLLAPSLHERHQRLGLRASRHGRIFAHYPVPRASRFAEKSQPKNSVTGITRDSQYGRGKHLKIFRFLSSPCSLHTLQSLSPPHLNSCSSSPPSRPEPMRSLTRKRPRRSQGEFTIRIHLLNLNGCQGSLN